MVSGDGHSERVRCYRNGSLFTGVLKVCFGSPFSIAFSTSHPHTQQQIVLAAHSQTLLLILLLAEVT